MNNEKTTPAITNKPLPPNATEAAPPMLIKKIGKTTYNVVVHFSETSKETLEDKVKRLILNNCVSGDN